VLGIIAKDALISRKKMEKERGRFGKSGVKFSRERRRNKVGIKHIKLK